MRGSAGAAGYDLCAAGNCVIPSRGKGTMETGLAVALPTGTYARIAPRSGLAIRNFINIGAGVLDSDYRGKIKVVLFNYSAEDFKVQAGDRIAQLILALFPQCLYPGRVLHSCWPHMNHIRLLPHFHTLGALHFPEVS